MSVEEFGIRAGRVHFIKVPKQRKRGAIEIRVHDLHFDIVLNGRVMAHSEDYASAAKARRAARALIDAIDTREMRLSYWMGRRGSQRRIEKVVRKLWTTQYGDPVAQPLGKSLFGAPPG